MKIFWERSPSLFYEEEKPPGPEVKTVRSKEKTLSSLMVSVREKKKIAATGSRRGKNGESGAKNKEVGINMNEEGVIMENKEMETENIKDIETENTKVV